MARATALATSDVLLASDIPIGRTLRSNSEITQLLDKLFNFSEENDDIHLYDELMRYSLKRSGGNKDTAAKLLGIAEFPID
jgi:hypothetical protein